MIEIKNILASTSLGEIRAEVEAIVNGESFIFSDIPLVDSGESYEDQVKSYILTVQPAP